MECSDSSDRITALCQKIKKLQNSSSSKDHQELLSKALDELQACLDRSNEEDELCQNESAEEALLENEEDVKRYRQLVELAQEGIWTIDTEGTTTYANPKMAEMLGYAVEEMLGKSFLVFMDDQGRETARRFFERRRQGVKESHEFEFVKKDGTRIYTSLSTSPIHDEKGIFTGALALVSDITESKQAVEKLQESRDYLDKIINSIGDPIFVKDRQHRYVLANEAQCNLAGHKREEIIGKTCYDFFPKEQADVFWKKDDEVFETGIENVNEEIVTDAKGTVRTVVSKKTPYKDNAGYEFLVGVVRDITDRKQMENELRRARDDLEFRVQERTAELVNANEALQSEIAQRKLAEEKLFAEQRKFQTLSESSPFGIALIDKDGTFSYINPEFKEMFGYDLNDVPSEREWFKKAYPDPAYRHEVVSAWINDLNDLKSDKNISRTFAVTCKDGTEKIIKFILVHHDTNDYKYQVSFEDITKRKQAEQELRASLQFLETLIDTIPSPVFYKDWKGNL
ncbi:MAG TPA: PAS domain S-box protein [Methanotrichaceae archaeon]|nr:PAS domain S-box protein [Methanotrichaceae archaeon]